MLHPIHHHIPLVHPVDDHLVKLRNHQLQIVHRPQRQQPNQQMGGILQIVPIDVLSEYHILPPLDKQKLMSV